MLNRHGATSRRRAAATLALFVSAIGVIASGCYRPLPGRDADQFPDLSAQTLVAGDNAARLAPNTVNAFSLEVATPGQDIEIILTPTGQTIFGVGFVESPDGERFLAYPGAQLSSSNGHFSVSRYASGTEGVGLRFVGTATSAGTWKFSILAQPPIDLAALESTINDKSVVENMIVVLYLLSGQPPLDIFLADILYWAYPELVNLRAALDVTVRVNIAEAGTIPPATPNDSGSGADGGGGGGSGGGGSGGGGGGSDGNGGGSGGNGGDPNDGGQQPGDPNDPNSPSDPNSPTDPNQPTDPNEPNGGVDPNTITPPPTSIVVETIVQTGDAVPGQTGATFTDFGNPIIDNEGRVAFFAGYSGGRGGAGLYVWQNGALERVIDTDPTNTGSVPGYEADDYFGGFSVRWDTGSPHLAWGSGGRLMFVTHISGISQPNALFRWRASDGDILLVSDTELMRTAIPDSTSEFLPEFYHPGVDDDGLAVFSNRYSYFRDNGSFSLFNLGVFATNGQTTDDLSANSVPGQPDFASFQDPILITSHNAAGEILVQFAYQSIEGNRGVYLLKDGVLSRIVDNATNRSFSGLALGTQVGLLGQWYDAIAIGPNGDVALDTTITQNDTTRDAVLRWTGTTWIELRGANNVEATDLLSGINSSGQAVYLADGTPYLGDGQTVSNLSTGLPAALSGVEIEFSAFGGAVNNQGRALLRYARTSDAGVGLLFWSDGKSFVALDTASPTGLESIDVIFPIAARGPDEVERVGTIATRPESNRPGLSGSINDRDEFVFRAGWRGSDAKENTNDDRQAIFFGKGQQ